MENVYHGKTYREESSKEEIQKICKDNKKTVKERQNKVQDR